MIHRVIQTSWDLEKRLVNSPTPQDDGLISGRQLLLTKGDNNILDDSLIYPEGQEYISRDEVVGFVRFYVPLVGWPVILAQSPGRWRDLSSRFAVAPEVGDESKISESFSIDL